MSVLHEGINQPFLFQELNLGYHAPRGVWILYPVLGGVFHGDTKKHHYTPIAKYYKFSQCGSRYNVASTSKENGHISDNYVEESLQSSLRSEGIDGHSVSTMHLNEDILGLEKRHLLIQIDGDWGPWTSWISCSISCGKGGFRKRTRKCDNPVPKGTGENCVGEHEQLKICMVAEI